MENKFNKSDVLEEVFNKLKSLKGNITNEISEDTLDSIIQSVGDIRKNISDDNSEHHTKSLNEYEIISENLDCVEMYLTYLEVPTHDVVGEKYSTVGRIKYLLRPQEEPSKPLGEYPKMFKFINSLVQLFCKHNYESCGTHRSFDEPKMDSEGVLSNNIQLMVCPKCGKMKHIAI